MAVRRTLAGSVAALLLPALLTGCGGDSSVADPPVESSPTSSSPTGDAAPHETAEHFIRRWAEAEKRMENTGETAPYLALSRGCRPCAQVAKQVHGFYTDGGYVKWGGWTIRSVARYQRENQSLVMKVRISSAPTEYKTSADSSIQHLEGGESTELLTLRRDGESWQMANTSELAS